MHEMQAIVTDVRSVCHSVCPSDYLSVCMSVCHAARAVRAASFGAAFAELLWLLAYYR